MTQDKVFREVVASKHKVRPSHIQFKLLVVLDTWTSLCGNPIVKKTLLFISKIIFPLCELETAHKAQTNVSGVPRSVCRARKKKMAPHHIAILGGGITGLSSAFHLSRRFPNALITLLEKESRLGGWLRSERVQLRDEQGTPATVVLEAGPRTLRPNAYSVLELVSLTVFKNVLLSRARGVGALNNPNS